MGISIGDSYVKGKKQDSKGKGKQFQVGKSSNEYFAKLQPLSIVPGNTYKSDPYSEPPHKPDNKQLSQDAGFGSKNGRGIQNSVRASRMYSEKLGMETKALRRTAFSNAATTMLDTSAAAEAPASGITLFDRCNAGEADD